jgi:CheY-like chemotaxis protein
MHACERISGKGQLLIETGNADLPRAGAITGFVTLSVTHTGNEPDLEKLFEPASLGEEGFALAMVHSVATEHGGYINVQRTMDGHVRFDLLLPRTAESLLLEPAPAQEGVPSVLLVDDRDRVRAQLHNYFESAGYNLLEAVDEQEALVLGEVHEGSLDLLIADARDADAIAAELQRTYPQLKILRIVDLLESSGDEIRRPFTQSALLEKVEELLGERARLRSAATTTSSF